MNAYYLEFLTVNQITMQFVKKHPKETKFFFFLFLTERFRIMTLDGARQGRHTWGRGYLRMWGDSARWRGQRRGQEGSRSRFWSGEGGAEEEVGAGRK